MAVRRCDAVTAAIDPVWHDAAAAAALPAGGKLAVTIAGWRVLLVHTDAGVFALNDRCSHAGSPLANGRVRRGEIICPLHGARFDIASGACLGAANPPLRHFPVAVLDGRIRVALPDRRPEMAEIPLPI